MTEVSIAAKRGKRWIDVVFLFVLGVFVFLAVNFTCFDVHNRWGDNLSTMLTMYSGKVFAERGFIETQFTPRIPWNEDARVETLYTHFPPLPYYFGGLLWKWGYTSLVYTKAVYIVLAGLFLWGMYVLAAHFFGPPMGLCTAIVLVFQELLYTQSCTTPVIWGDAFWIWGIYALVRAADSSGRRQEALFALAWLLVFINDWSTFEHIVAAQLVAIVVIFLLIKGNKKRFAWIMLMGMAPVLMVSLHFLANAWALGGIKAAFNDLATAFLWRTEDLGRGTNYLATITGGSFYAWTFRQLTELYGLAPFYSQFFDAPLRSSDFNEPINHKMLLVYLPFLSCFAAIAWAYLNNRHRALTRLFLILLATFCVADLSFWLIFRQLAAIHLYRQVGRLWLPTYSLLVGGALYFMLLGCFGKATRLSRRLVSCVFLCILLTIPARNAWKTLADMPVFKEDTWQEDVRRLRNVDACVEKNALVATDQPSFAEAAFLHQPPESFGMKGFDVLSVDLTAQSGDTRKAQEKPYYLQLAAIYLYRQVGRLWLPTYCLLVGGALYFMLLRCFGQAMRLSRRLVWCVFLCILLTIPARNAWKTLAHMPVFKEDTSQEDVHRLRNVDARVEKNALVATDQSSFAEQEQPHYLWSDRYSFSFLGTKRPDIVTAYEKYLVVGDYALYRYIGKDHSSALVDLSPADSAVSDSKVEVNSLGNYVATYGGQASAVPCGELRDGVASGEYCIKIVTQDDSKSGIQNRSDVQIGLKAQTYYQLSWWVYCEESLSDFRGGIATEEGTRWTTGRTPNINSFANTPGVWTEFKGVFFSEKEQDVRIFLHQNALLTLTWYVDDVRLQELPS